MNRNCSLIASALVPTGTIRLGNGVRLGPGVTILAAGHDPDDLDRRDLAAPVVIGDNVWVGGNSVVRYGVTIGENTVVGAGSVVTKDLEANAIYAGVPARLIRRRTMASGTDQ
ncbi:MAG: hypothetical protein KGP12_11660 [Actinomycetales bacterium]|nr:hypothetical protein [Actinomycetales bacterium]